MRAHAKVFALFQAWLALVILAFACVLGALVGASARLCPMRLMGEGLARRVVWGSSALGALFLLAALGAFAGGMAHALKADCVSNGRVDVFVASLPTPGVPAGHPLYNMSRCGDWYMRSLAGTATLAIAVPHGNATALSTHRLSWGPGSAFGCAVAALIFLALGALVSGLVEADTGCRVAWCRAQDQYEVVR